MIKVIYMWGGVLFLFKIVFCAKIIFMRQTIYLLAFTLVYVFCTNSSFAQGVSFNTTGAAADASAMLDVASTSKGVLVPRMTGAQKWAISSPATGLMIFQTDSTAGFYYYSGSVWSAVGGGGSSLPSGTTGDLLYYNGSSWVSLPIGANGKVLVVQSGVPTWMPTTILTVGTSYGGGVIAYLLQSGDIGYDPSVQHGLIAATSDQSTGVRWYNGSNTITYATGTVIGTGLSNTMAIIANQLAGSYAATVARSYTGGGFTDWYLPSKDELNKLYINKTAIGGFAVAYYWSSSESFALNAWNQNFNSGTQNNLTKSATYYVRAVRAF